MHRLIFPVSNFNFLLIIVGHREEISRVYTYEAVTWNQAIIYSTRNSATKTGQHNHRAGFTKQGWRIANRIEWVPVFNSKKYKSPKKRDIDQFTQTIRRACGKLV